MSQMLFDQKNANSGNAISIDNIKNVGYLNTIQTISAASGTVTPNLALGGIVILNITANAAITIGAPINMPVPFGPGATAAGYEWTLYVQNKSGGALTTGPVFGAGYRAPAITNPGNNLAVVLNLLFDGTSHVGVGAWAASGV